MEKDLPDNPLREGDEVVAGHSTIPMDFSYSNDTEKDQDYDEEVNFLKDFKNHQFSSMYDYNHNIDDFYADIPKDNPYLQLPCGLRGAGEEPSINHHSSSMNSGEERDALDDELDTILNREMYILNGEEEDTDDEEDREVVEDENEEGQDRQSEGEGGQDNQDEGEERQHNQDEGEEKQHNQDMINAIRSAFASSAQIENAGNLVKLFAKAFWTEKENMDQRNERSEDLGKTFISEGNVMKCKPCVNYVTSSNVPKHLRKFYRGKPLGIIKKKGFNNRFTTKSMNRHVNSPIHKWAVKEYRSYKVQKKKHDEDTFEAAKNIVRNALFCFKDPEKSSIDFIKMNDLDNLKGLKNATVNDGRQNYFALRNMVYEKMLVKIG